jgi:hypothetical protein
MSQASCKSRYGVRYLQEKYTGPDGPKRRAYAMRRIPPSSKLRQEVEEVFTGWETKGASAG